MFFLLRTAFWLSIVLALLPSGGSKSQAPVVGPSEAVSAAFAAVSDVSGFCERQPDACDVGAQAALAFGQRAQAGAKFLYDYLSEKRAPASTGSIKASSGVQDTLTAEDIKPAWRGPLPPRDPRRPA